MASDHDDEVCNTSTNLTFENVLAKNISRRYLLKGSLAAATTTFLMNNTFAHSGHHTLMNFEPVAITDGSGPWPCISPDYQWNALLPWGEPLQPDGPAFSYPPSAIDQSKQVGIGHDGMHYFPIKNLQKPRLGWDDVSDWQDDKDWYSNLHKHRYSSGNQHGILCINHEFGTNLHVLGKNIANNLEEVRTSQFAHGVSVVEIQEHFGRWSSVKSEYSRRIHVNSPVVFSGPAANSDLLKTHSDNPPLGTVSNCSNGYTPWGTYLTCEENFNGCFAANSVWAPTHEQLRYGFTPSGFGYGWERYDERKDATLSLLYQSSVVALSCQRGRQCDSHCCS